MRRKLFGVIASTVASWGWRNRSKLINSFKGRPSQKDHEHRPAEHEAPLDVGTAHT